MNKIDEYVDSFIKIISSDYNINYTDIKNKWLSFIDLNSLTKKGKVKEKEQEQEKVKEKEKEQEKVKEKEKEQEKVKEKEKEQEKVKKNIDSDSKDEDEFVVRKKKTQQIYSGVLIRFNRIIRKYVHKDSGMVFYSKDELVVYAKILENSLYKLTVEDKETCKKLKFRIDPSLYNEESIKARFPNGKEDENYVYNCVYDIDETILMKQ
jgi:carotenoid cleavage dioxygenase-like enzyme